MQESKKEKFHRRIHSKDAKEARNAYLFMSPYILLFSLFIIVPIIIAIILSFTSFNGVNKPVFNFLDNYIYLFTNDTVFVQNVLPNTIKFALIVGVGGYVLSFFMAWCLAQLPRIPRTILSIILYTPSMTMGIAMGVLWIIIFSGSETGYLNSVLITLGLINEPIEWLQNPAYLMNIMILVSLWGSLGVGFLAMLSGILNIPQDVYEAAYVDGMKNRFQEIFYITIPMMKPQMLFGAVMSVVNTFAAGAIGVTLSGSNPTPQYAGQLIINHIDDYIYNKYEFGMACAVTVVLLFIILIISKIAYRLFGSKGR
jgi:multiple sugar transport system permease protein